MKLRAKIYVSLLSTVLTLGVAFENSLVAQDASNWFSRAMSTVNDTLTSAFGEDNQVAIKTLRQARQSYSDILTEETTTKIENVLLQGDEDTIKVLTRRIAKDFRKPTKSSLKSFVAWFEEWEKEGNVNLVKFTESLPSLPAEEDYLSKAINGNIYAQTVLLWIYRSNGKYTQAAEMEETLKATNKTATQLKADYKEDYKLVEDDAKNTKSSFWQSVCGEMELRGYGVSQDYSGALNSYRKAALQGFTPAIFQLVRIVNTSNEAKDSHRFEALLWLKKLSLINDNPVAEMGAGLMYMNGEGVSRDYAMAAICLGYAAAAGVPEAMFALGKIYENGGVGLTKDTALAGAWYSLAKEYGYEYESTLDVDKTVLSELKETITKELTPDEKVLAKLLFKDLYKE